MSKQVLAMMLLVLLLTEVHSDDDANASEVRAPAKCKKPNGKIGQTKIKGCSTTICKKNDGGGAAWEECPRPASAENVNQGMQSIRSLLKEVLTNLGDTFDTSVNNELKVITDLLQGPLLTPIVTLLKEILGNLGNPFDVSVNNELKVITYKLDEIIRILTGPATTIWPIITESSGLRVVFEKIEEFPIEKDNLLSTLSFLGKQFRIVFDLHIASPWGGVANIIHFTTGGDSRTLKTNTRSVGERTPAIWVVSPSGGKSRIYIASAINGTSAGEYLEETLTAGRWNKVEMSQIWSDNGFMFSYKVNDVMYWSVENTQPMSFANVLMYASSNVWPTLTDGKIRNFVVETIED